MKFKPTTSSPKTAKPKNLQANFPIVAIGASDGGIEALAALLHSLAEDTGMGFIVIQHLDRRQQSILPELLARETLMPVAQVRDGMKVLPNHIYVIPPNTSMTLSGGTLQLAPREKSRVAHMPIDHFMRSLAQERGDQSVGVILSGSGSDGTLGVAEIQGQGGVTFAQDEASAKHNGMPKSAAAGGSVDYVLPPRAIARELKRIAQHPHVTPPLGGETAHLLAADRTGLASIFQLLYRAKSVDFSHYRQTSVLRRIQRRMIVNKIDALEDYVKFIHLNPPEIKSLFQDLLISVTSFFRDPRVFDVLKLKIFPRLLKNRDPGLPLRIWTPGCASGQETYSVAMAMLEFLGDKGLQTPVQMFGTDVSETAIARARSGMYSANIQGDVSAERLRRFFLKVGEEYQISKAIRDSCIFARHDVSRDPPFSQMDLICCRNVLIYLDSSAQNKVLSMFHYALRPAGYLVLGASEGVSGAANLFATEDRTYKIFTKKPGVRHLHTFSLNRQMEWLEYGGAPPPSRQLDVESTQMEVQKEFDRTLLTQYIPAVVFVNEDLEIVHTRGNVSRYLKLASGRASLNLMKMAREGLLLELKNAITKSKKEEAVVRKENVPIHGEGGAPGKAARVERLVNFEVFPIHVGEGKELYYVIVFQEAVVESVPRHARRLARPTRETHLALERVAKLEQELEATKEYLQSVIETREATNEDLQSANEEILSSNEELQSTNEELEASKEELQSTNEELRIVNDELRSRHTELTVVNDDLMSVLLEIDIALMMIGKDLTVQRFTPSAQQILGLTPADILIGA